MKEKNKKKILRDFLLKFFKKNKDFIGEMSFETIDQWDSISHIDLVIQLEKKFKKNLRKKYHLLSSESKILKEI